MWLFLAALAMLFASSLLGYFLIRLRLRDEAATTASATATLRLPWLLWVSTLLLLGSSLAMQQALAAVRRERQRAFRIALLTATGLTVAFVAVQTPAMLQLLHRHAQLRSLASTSAAPLGAAPGAGAAATLYGLIFFLVLLHAVHVLGGLVAAGVFIRGAWHNRYDHEHHAPVRHAALYWHFLDAVWLVMFLSLWLVG
jgi:heme/copper-type cytochrome/quinol oxidase subunit 3